MDLLRELKKRQRSSQGKLKLMSICIDGNKADCKRNPERDSISWPNVCNGDLLADKTLLKLGLIGIPRQHRAEEWQNRGAEPEEE